MLLSLCFQEFSNCEVKDVALPESKYILPSPELGEDTWDYKNHRWSKKKSDLCTYEWYISAITLSLWSLFSTSIFLRSITFTIKGEMQKDRADEMKLTF